IDVMRQGGAQRVLKVMLEILQKQGYEVCLVVLKKTKDLVQLQNTKVIYLLKNENQPLLANSFYLLEEFSNLAKEYDLIVSFMDFITSYYASLVAKILVKPYYAFVRCEPSYVACNFPQAKINQSIYAMCLQGARAVVCNSKASLKDVQSNFGVLPSKTILLYNPIHFPVINYQEEEIEGCSSKKEIFCLAIGRLHPQKNYLTLFEAFKNLPTSIKLYVLGEGDQREELESYCRRSKIANIVLLGFREDVSLFFKKADIFIHASTYEGLPNAVLEAASFGIPSIVSDIPVHREIFGEGEGALFFDPANVQGICDNIQTLIHDDSLYVTLRRQSAKIAKKFSLEAFSKGVLSIFENAKNQG
ncbi:MAG: glycosyltransferase, partial [Helicobacter sp.]|nr:glycosyltransferase [Helicobacter sp.]